MREEWKGETGNRQNSCNSPDVDNRLNCNPRCHSGSDEHAKAIWCSKCRLHPKDGEQGEATEHGNDANEAKFVCDDRKNEVAMGERQVTEF